MEPREIDLMARLEREHWWFVGKRLAISALLERCGLPPGSVVVDVGCGTGANLALLAKSHRALGLDHDTRCLDGACRLGGLALARASAEALPLAGGSVDLALCADVLYHRQVDHQRALAELSRVLRPGGWLLILDSAYQGLAGPHDRAMHGARRFTAGGMAVRLRRHGLVPVRVGYRNCLLAPALIPLRLAQRLRQRPGGPAPASDVALPPPALNRLLIVLMRLEAAWLRRRDLPFGTSVALLARKPY